MILSAGLPMSVTISAASGKRVHEFGILTRLRLQAVEKPRRMGRLGGSGNELDGVRSGGRRILAGEDAALLRRAMHHDPATQLGTKLDKPAQHFQRPGSHRRVGTGDREPGGSNEQPMQSDHLQSGIGDQPAYALPFRFFQTMRLGPERERGELQAVIAEPCGEIDLPFQGQLAQDLIAQRDLHGRVRPRSHAVARNPLQPALGEEGLAALERLQRGFDEKLGLGRAQRRAGLDEGVPALLVTMQEGLAQIDARAGRIGRA